MTKDQSRMLARRAFLSVVDEGGKTTETVESSALAEVIRVDDVRATMGPVVCTIGAFDGIHWGHRFLFSQVRDDAHNRGVASAIVTFDPDPDELFKPLVAQRKILSNADRIEFLRRFGTDFVIVISFTRELSARSATSFVDEVLSQVCEPVAIHVGEDFRLGADNVGSVESLRELGRERGFDVYGHDLRCAAGRPVSATRIRDLLEHGGIDDANDLLCRPHFVRGEVVSGRHQGTDFGFPTANVRVFRPYVLPAEGVYAGYVLVDGVAYPAAINVGAPRTFASPEDDDDFLEANLLGYHGDLYGSDVAVAFVRRLRPQKKFDTVEELIAVVERNIAWVRDNLGDEGLPLDA